MPVLVRDQKKETLDDVLGTPQEELDQIHAAEEVDAAPIPTTPDDEEPLTAEASTSVFSDAPDIEASIVDWLNDISTLITTHHKLEPIAMLLEGNTTAVTLNRMRTGYSITVGAKALIQPAGEFFNRLLHEVVHVENDRDFVRDVCGSGAYHTEAFRNTAATLDVTAEWAKSYGFGHNVHSNDLSVYNFPVTDMDMFILPPTTQLLAKNRKKAQRESGEVVGREVKIYEVECPHCGEILKVRRGVVLED